MSGRPPPDGIEVVWPGKYVQGRRSAPRRHHPSLHVRERIPRGEGSSETWAHKLVLADNLLAMDALLDQYAGHVDLAYLDPPFSTGTDFEVVVPVGDQGTGSKTVRWPAYSDRWEGGPAGFLSMLDSRLRCVHELLAPHGSLYIHVDPTMGHAIKLLLDEIFGPGCFQREIVWRIGWVSGFKTRARNWIRNHDLIFFYVKDPKNFTFNKLHVPYPDGYRRRDGSLPRGKGIPLDDVWNASSAELMLTGAESLDSIQIKSFSREKTGYATQKNESILHRIVAASSDPRDLVMDCFCGSGTSLAVADRLQRRWIGIDTSPMAIHIARKRLTALGSGAAMEVCGLGSIERRVWAVGEDEGDPGRRHRDRIIERHGGSPVPDGGMIHGSKDDIALYVGALDAPVDDVQIAGAAEHAARAGFERLEVLAWEYELLNWRGTIEHAGADVTLLRVPRETLHGRGVASFPEKPHVRIALHGLASGEIEAELQEYRFGHPERIDPAVGKSVRDWQEWIDGWMVDWDRAVTAPFHARATSSRTAPHRSLSLRLGPHRHRGRQPKRVCIRVFDLFGHCDDVEFLLEPDGQGWRVAATTHR